MSLKNGTWIRTLMVAAVALPLAACGDDTLDPGEQFENPSTVRVQNELMGPILFFHARACGTTNWGPDLLPLGPVEGTIQPGDSKDFTVEAGCYDFRAQHLETTDPGPLITKIMADKVASPVTILTLTFTEVPSGPM